jgi:hypothetical protein
LQKSCMIPDPSMRIAPRSTPPDGMLLLWYDHVISAVCYVLYSIMKTHATIHVTTDHIWYISSVAFLSWLQRLYILENSMRRFPQ